MGPLRISELRRLCLHRYPSGHLPPNEEGRGLLTAVIRHMVFSQEENIGPFVSQWANWMSAEELAEVVEQAKWPIRRIRADEAGQMVKLTTEERTRLRITTIRPADVKEQEFLDRSKEFKRLRDRERQRVHREKMRRAVARREVKLTEREGTLYGLLKRRWRRIRSLVEKVEKMSAFEELSSASIKVSVHRILNQLENKHLVESRLVDGPKNFRAREVRRKHMFAVTVKPMVEKHKKTPEEL